MNDPNKLNPKVCEEERPPIFKTWRRLYGVVFGNLILLIGLFYLLTRYFA
jgi:hypothetical protein